MTLNILYVSANGTSNGRGSQSNPMDLKTAVQTGGANSVIVLLNNAGPISTEGVALHSNQYLLGAGAKAEVYHSDGITKTTYTAPGQGGTKLIGTSSHNAVVGTHPNTDGSAVAGVTASGGVNNAGLIAETRYHFVLSGQSNMAGWANASDFDKELQGVQDDVKIWTGNQFENLDPTGNSAPLDFGVRPYASWAGSELSLGANLAEALGMAVYFTKITAGATSIDSWINGNILQQILNHSLKASQEIAAQGYAPIMGGMAWNQGENDRFNAESYDQKLLKLLNLLQEGMGISDLNLIASGVSPQQGGDVIEEEILQAAQASQFIQYFSMLDFTESSNGYNHFSAEAYSYMGYQFAVRFLENLMGNPVSKDDITGYIPPRLHPTTLEAQNDHVNIVVGLTANEGNVLENDSDYNPNGILHISQINGNKAAVGQWIELQEGGRIKIDENGNYLFDAQDDFKDLKTGEVVDIKMTYEVTDTTGLSHSAEITLSVYGSNGRQGGAYIEAQNSVTRATNGDDVIIGSHRNDVIYGLQGFDMIFDYEGHNTIYASNNGYYDNTSRSLIFTGDGNDNIYATNGKDIIDAQNGRNMIYAYGGDDEITTGSGDDLINARAARWLEAAFAGDKTIYSGDGRDYIYTGVGDDKIFAGNGDKYIYAAGGNDYIHLGDGDNYIDAGYNRYQGEEHSIYVQSGDGNNRFYSGASSDEITFGHGNNTIYSYGGNDKITVGDGNNIIHANISWAYGEGEASYVMAGHGSNRIYTGRSDDFIATGNGDNRIETYGGNDRVITGSGDDIILLYSYNRNDDLNAKNVAFSGGGSDSIYGSYGDDIINAGTGDDRIDITRGGENTLIFESNAGHDRINGFSASSDIIQFDIEGLGFDDLNITGTRNVSYISYEDNMITVDIGVDYISENMFLFA